MRKEAEEHAEEDRKKKERIEVRNNAETLVYSTEKTLEELKDKISKEKKEKVESALEALKESLKKDDIDDIKKKSEELTKALGDAAAEAYQRAEAAQSTGEQKKWEGHPSDSVDTDYEVKE